MWKAIKPYVISIAIALSVGGLSGFLIRDSIEQYRDLTLPALAPPAMVFPIVWTILYILMGISAARIYKQTSTSYGITKEGKSALIVYALQLVVNFIWPILFFNLEMRFAAYLCILLLLLLVIIMIIRFCKIDKAAAWLQIPYLLWLFYASYLNLSIYFLNK